VTADVDADAGSRSSASLAVRGVSAGLVRLAANSAAVLAEPAADDPQPEPAGDCRQNAAPRAEAERLRALLRQLRAQDLAAIRSVEALLPALRGILGAPDFGVFSAAMADLDFPRACSLLSSRLPLLQPAPLTATPAVAAVAATARGITD
jgi:hypothetical protein